MNLIEVYKTLTDHERLILLSCFGMSARHVWVSRTDSAARGQLTGNDIGNMGLNPIMELLKKQLIRNLEMPHDPFKFNVANPNAVNHFTTTSEGNLVVLTILQAEYGYDQHPNWLEQEQT